MPRRVIVREKAGSGKRTLIKAITSVLAERLNSESFRLMAPAGAAAINVNGATVHSSWKLFGQIDKIEKLASESERAFQLEYEAVQFVICDEYSMVGCRMLNAIHARCRQAKANYDQPFGNVFVYLVEDSRQLPPAQDSVVYTPPARNASAEIILGRSISAGFQRCFSLSVSQGQTASQKDFRAILDRISFNESTAEDHCRLMTRRSAQNLDLRVPVAKMKAHTNLLLAEAPVQSTRRNSSKSFVLLLVLE